jgi:hypothetical protein
MPLTQTTDASHKLRSDAPDVWTEDMALVRLLEPGTEKLQQIDHTLGQSFFAKHDV